MLRKFLRKTIRVIFRVREYETINSAIDRHIVKIKKMIFPHRKFNNIEFKNALLDLGITKGDNIMVHSSWRQFYNYLGTPIDAINILRNIIGDEGTIFMPSYGPTRTFFDVNETKTSAGVLAEEFRKQPNVFRSACTHFSVCAQGPLAQEATKDHFYSEYGFDMNSPYYKFANLNKSKILFMGLGKKPTKISLFHCAGYILKDSNPFLKKLLSHQYDAILVVNNEKYDKKMIIRDPKFRNNNKSFKLIFDRINNKKITTISNLDLVIIDAQEGLHRALEYAKKGVYCYK